MPKKYQNKQIKQIILKLINQFYLDNMQINIPKINTDIDLSKIKIRKIFILDTEIEAEQESQNPIKRDTIKILDNEEELVEKISYLINDLKEMEGYIKYPKFDWKINCKMIYEYKNKNLLQNTSFIMNWDDFQAY